MTDTKDYYATLGVSRDADADEIKKAFRRRAREVHPDTSEDSSSDEEFKELNEAYEVLCDPERRAYYDRFGTADPRRIGGGYGDGDDFGVGFGDLFTTIFDGMGGGAARMLRREGRDMAAQVVVTLLEAADGGSHEIRYTRDAPCDTCGASGAAEGGSVVTCPECNGSGQQRSERRTFIGTFQSVQPCSRCGTLGSVAEPPCPSCGGSGRAARAETVTVDLPAGVVDGARMVVAAMGEAGLRGAAAGDLVVGVHVRPHEFLHRQIDDLHCRADVPMVRAALGGEIEVEGLRGPVTARVPAGAQNGDTVAVKGEGMPRQRGGAGDLVVHVNVTVPKKLKKRERELLEELAGPGGAGESTTLHRIRDWLGA